MECSMFVQDVSSRVDGQNLAARRAKTRGTTQTFDGFIRNQENDSFSTWVIFHERQGNSFRLGLKIRKVKLMQFVDCPVQLFRHLNIGTPLHQFLNSLVANRTYKTLRLGGFEQPCSGDRRSTKSINIADRGGSAHHPK